MRYKLISVFILIAYLCPGQEQYQLAPPLVKYPSSFFSVSVTVTAAFDQPGAKIVYTTDGSIPGTNSPVYKKPLAITRNTHLQIRAVGAGFEASPVVEAFLYKEGVPIQKILFTTPDPKYTPRSSSALNDNIGGINNISNGNWLGYLGDTATFTIDLYRKEKVKSLLANFLQSQESWIFFPQKVTISFWDTVSGHWKELMTENYTFPESEKNIPRRGEIDFPFTISATKLKITAYPLLQIPDWHAGKGNPAWFFIDEIKLY